MIEKIKNMFSNLVPQKKTFEPNNVENSKNYAKERLHVLLVQDRTNISADFLDIMKDEIIQVAEKYVVLDKDNVEVQMTNSLSNDGKSATAQLNIKVPVKNIKNEMKTPVNNVECQEVKLAQELEKKKNEALENPEQEEQELEPQIQIDDQILEKKEFLEKLKQINTDDKSYLEDEVVSKENDKDNNQDKKDNEVENKDKKDKDNKDTKEEKQNDMDKLDQETKIVKTVKNKTK